MSSITPYLGFNGKTREAMTFYQQCLGGELIFQTMGESPAPCPEGVADQIMHSMLKKGNLVLFASDMTGPEGFNPGNDINLAINGESAEELQRFFDNLSEGGKIIEPLEMKPWGLFGSLRDKFGKNWMFHYSEEN